jgi:NAD+ synthetase
MRVALAQLNTCVGDLSGNVNRSLAAFETARNQHADLVVLPEMTIPGYPPRDILFDPTFTAAVIEATHDLARRTAGGPPVIAGSLARADHQPPHHPGLHNAAWLLHNGHARLIAAKRLLPAYDVFHEPRWFLPGRALPPVMIAGCRVGVMICEDMWDEGYALHPADELRAAGAELLVCISASPYHRDVLPQRLHHARRHRSPLIYLNLAGATDELIFDGRSFVLDASGDLRSQLCGFEEEIRVVDAGSPSPLTPFPPGEGDEAELFRALVLGVRDFARKNGIEHACLGLSGGVDSSVVAALAAEALGPGRVTGLAIPSRFTDPRSTDCARDLAAALGIGFEVVELEALHRAAEDTLGEWMAEGTTAENVQARLRAMVLMSFVNRVGGMLLNTSNKTELSLGYGTLYGDMAGSLCPIADLTKPEVYALARWINAQRPVIPDFVLSRPPSAELRPEQVDPFDYDTVSPAMERLVRENRSDAALRRSEHKRWQSGVILKVSEKAFGTGRLIPITRR